MHRPIFLKGVSLSFTNKICFEKFSAQIYPGSRIAIIGKNGSGKSSLLNILRQKLQPSDGEIVIPDNLCISYVEQTINDFSNLSGGQRLNKKLSEALAQFPDVLLLDEPTNHLDQDNRKSLIRMLKHYQGTLVIVSHDTELLRNCINTLWYIDNNKIHNFTGSYEDYIREIKQKRTSIEKELTSLKTQKKNTHNALMKEQKRAAKSKAKGQKSIEQKKWPTVVSKSKAFRAEQTSGKKKLAIDRKKQQLTEQLSDLRLPEIILPKFSLTSNNISSNNLLSISSANIGYNKDKPILKNINLSLGGKERIALCGKNASGKSTLLKAILGLDEIFTTGKWYLPVSDSIGYLDQHYTNLNPELSVIDHIKKLRPNWTEIEIRRHLNDFLFRKNEEAMQPTATLSGGEKARASLSMIAAKTPRLLILDEITNNLDLETKEHCIQVLKEYPDAIIIVSHEEDFLQAIGIDQTYTVINHTISS
ncbi:MAG: ABC-F family ATP-binding cassette domain-containing protein [Epsilonproteobacteria bacterium]|nr:ABC-F family ATP-binding cassette domain-containing protein [Campylobacterota bacterium]